MQVLFSKELNNRLAARAAAAAAQAADDDDDDDDDDDSNDNNNDDDDGNNNNKKKKKIKQTVFSNAIHPGFVLTDLDRDMGWTGALITIFRRLAARPARDGAVTQTTVATTPELDGVGGRYFSDACMNDLCDPSSSLNSIFLNKEHAAAEDDELRAWLWDTAAELTGEDLDRDV